MTARLRAVPLSEASIELRMSEGEDPSRFIEVKVEDETCRFILTAVEPDGLCRYTPSTQQRESGCQT